jgi:serine/threonine protein kinase
MEVILKTVSYTRSLPVTTSSNELLPIEIHNLLKLSHPNVQRLLDFTYCCQNKAWTLTLEHSSRWQPLSDVITVTTPDEDEVRHIIQQTLSAVIHCLDHGVDHRDISVNNIYLDPNTREIKLGNFHHSTILSVLPHTLRHLASSPSSCPPEIYRRGFYSPQSAVVWSIGCLLFELLSGSKPLLSVADSARNNVRWETLPPRSVSSDAYSLILQCLNPSPEHRIPLSMLLRHPWIVNETAV